MNVDMKVKQMAKNPKALEIIDKYVPGFSTNRQLKLAYGMSMRSLYDFPQMAPYKKDLDALNAELEALGD